MQRIAFAVFCLWFASPAAASESHGPWLMAQAEPESSPSPLPPAEPSEEGPDLTEPDPSQPEPGIDDGETPDDLSIGEIPLIETMELTPDIAKRALDSYFLVSEKFKDAELDLYENLQDFVDQNILGKDFEADIKAAGFATVTEWNTAITSVSFAYIAVIDDQTVEIQQQIADLEADAELAQDMKDRMIASLKAMIPSDNNRGVIEALLDDPIYGERLKQLDIGEE